MTQSQSLKEQLLKLKESGNGAISAPYDVNIFGDLTANGLNFGKITCSENTMGHIITAANSFDILIDIAIGLSEAATVINEGDTVFKMAASRVENCRCSHETCEMCVLARAIINQVEVQVRVLSEAAEKVRGMR